MTRPHTKKAKRIERQKRYESRREAIRQGLRAGLTAYWPMDGVATDGIEDASRHGVYAHIHSGLKESI